jgi:nitrogen fixation NifU-like protein
MDDMYRDYILDHFKNPRNHGELEKPDISYSDSNPICGDEIRIDMKLEDGRVSDIRFSGRGCAISTASASILTETIKGLSLDEVKKLGRKEMLEMLGIPLTPVRVKCALLALKAVKAGAYGLTSWPGVAE